MSLKREKRTNNGESMKIWFWLAVTFFVIGIFSYGFLFRGVMVSLVARQAMESNLTALNVSVLSLEADYLKAKNNITPELATSLGFITPTNKKFVMINSVNPGLSLLTKGD